MFPLVWFCQPAREFVELEMKKPPPQEQKEIEKGILAPAANVLSS